MKDLARNDESGHNSGAFRHLGNNNDMLNNARNRPRQEPLRSEPLNQSSNRSLTPGRHGNGAFRHAGQPSQSKAAQNGLDQLGKASGLTGKGGKLNQFGQGVKDVGKRTPDLDRVPTNFRNARAAMPNMGATSGPGQDGDMPGLSSRKHNGPQSGLPDPDKDPSRQHQPGNGDKQPNNNGMENPLGKYGKYAPAALQKLGGKAGKAYGKTMSGFVSGVQKVGKQFGLHLGKAASVKIVHWLMISAVGAGLFGIGWAYNNDDQVLDGGPVCSTQNTGQSYSGLGGSGGAAGAADLSNPNAKKIFDYLTKHDGFSGAGASGAVAVAQRESGFDPKAKNSGGGVAGIFQWSGWGNKVNGDRIHQGGFIKSESDLTLANELKLMDYEFKHGHGETVKKVGNAKDPGKAALDWSESYEGVALSDGQTKGGQIQAWAQQAYAKFHGASIHANSAKLNALAGSGNSSIADNNSVTAESMNNANCNKNGNGPVVAGAWTWPFSNFKPGSDISSGFGAQPGRNWHDGIDIGTATNTGAVHAIHGGVVKSIKCIGNSQSDLGYYIAIESPDGYSEIYQEFAFSMADGNRLTKVRVGDHVKTGQVITRVDPTTPNCTHIHIGVYKGSVKKMLSVGEAHYSEPGYGWQDPEKIIKAGLGK